MRVILYLIGILMISGSVGAGEIKAIVNDTPISAFDVDARAKMMMLQQAGQVGKITESLRKEALDDLIDERIKMQEMIKQNVSVSSEEVANTLAHLEAQNRLPPGGFKTMMEEHGIPYKTLLSQTEANLGWMRLIQKSGRSIAIKPAEIKARHKMIKKELSQETVSLAEIVVATEDEADKILEQLQQGSDFGELVDLYSTADSRLNGGLLGYVPTDYYGKDVAEILEQMSAGQISRPVPVPGGYAILLILNKREPVTGDSIQIWEMAQAVIAPDSVANTLLREPIENGCLTFRDIVKDEAVENSFQYGQINPAQLPPEIAPLLKEAPLQTVIGPVQTPVGLLYFMKCGESEQRIIPTDEELAAQIESEKLELVSRQLLSELKRDVVVEYK